MIAYVYSVPVEFGEYLYAYESSELHKLTRITFPSDLPYSDVAHAYLFSLLDHMITGTERK